MLSSPNRLSKSSENDGDSRFSSLINVFLKSQNDKNCLASCFQYYSENISGYELSNRNLHIIIKFVDYFAVDKKSLSILEIFQETLCEMINMVYGSKLLEGDDRKHFLNSIFQLILNIVSSAQENSNYPLFLDNILSIKEVNYMILSPNNISDLFKILFNRKQKIFISTFLSKTKEFNIQNDNYVNALNSCLKLIEENEVRHLPSAFEFLGNIAVCQEEKSQFFESFFHLIEEKSAYLKTFTFLARYFNILNHISNQTMINIIEKNGNPTVIYQILLLIAEIEDKELIKNKLMLKLASLKMSYDCQKLLLDQFIIFAYCYENSDEILFKFFKKLVPFWKTDVKPKILFELINQFDDFYDQICLEFLINTDQEQFCDILKSGIEDIEFLCQAINIALYNQVSYTGQLINMLINWEENKINCEQFFQALFKNKSNAEKTVEPFLRFCQMDDPNKYVFTYFARYAIRHSGFLEGFIHNSNLEIFFSHLNTFPAANFLASLSHKLPKNEKIEWYSRAYYEKSLLKKLTIQQLTRLIYGLWPIESRSIKVEYKISDEKICIRSLEVKVFLDKIKNKEIPNYLNSGEDSFPHFYRLVSNASCDIESLIRLIIDLCEKLENKNSKEKMKSLFEAVLFKKSNNCEVSVNPLIEIISKKKGQINPVIFESYIEFAAHQKKFVSSFCQPKNLEIYCQNMNTIDSVDLLASLSNAATEKNINLIESYLLKNYEHSILSKLSQNRLYLFACGLSQNSTEKPDFLIFNCFNDKFEKESENNSKIELMKLLLSNNNEIEIRIENGDTSLRKLLFDYFKNYGENVEYSILRVIIWAEKRCEVTDFFDVLLTEKNAVRCVNPFISFLAKYKTMCNLTYHMYTKKLAHNIDFVTAFLTDRNLSVFFNALNSTAGVDFLAAVASNGPFEQIDKFVRIYFNRSVLKLLNDDELLNLIFGLPHDNVSEKHETVFIRNVFIDPFSKDKKYIVRCEGKKDRLVKILDNTTIKEAIEIISKSLHKEKIFKEKEKFIVDDAAIEEEDKNEEDEVIESIEIRELADYPNSDDLFNQIDFEENIVNVTINH